MLLPSVFWIKKNLRFNDNPALYLANKSGPIIILVPIEPSIWTAPDTSDRHLYFYLNVISDLSKQLLKSGLKIYWIESEMIHVLEELKKQIGHFNLYSNLETGNLISFKRDKEVKFWCDKNSIHWLQPRQNNVIRNLDNRDLWTKHWRSFMGKSCLPPPDFNKMFFNKSDQLTNPFNILNGESPNVFISKLKLKNQICKVPKILLPQNPRLEALNILKSFLYERARDYQSGMSSPISSQDSCSRLSPYITWGVLSIREVYKELNLAKEFWKREHLPIREKMLKNLNSFEKRLHWRCHFIQKLETEPEIEFRCIHPHMRELRNECEQPDSEKFLAWKNSKTGIDFVDACMNFLTHNGWLNFRMRAMLMSFASYNLWLHWKLTGEHLAKLFMDYEPGIHWPQVQMQSGTTGINTIRIYNPIKQQKEYDPDLEFTRRWTQPSLMNSQIVSTQISLSEARNKIWKVKNSQTFKEISKEIYLKHGSRLKRTISYKNKNIISKASKEALNKNYDLFSDDG